MVRVVVGLVLVSVGAVEPALEAVYYAREDWEWKEYFCIEPSRFWRDSNHNGGGGGGWSAGRFGNNPRNSTYDGVTTINTSTNMGDGWLTGSNNKEEDNYRSTNIQECKLLRSRSILTFI